MSQAFTQHQTPRTSQPTQRRNGAVVHGQRSGEERSFFCRTPILSYDQILHWRSFRWYILVWFWYTFEGFKDWTESDSSRLCGEYSFFSNTPLTDFTSVQISFTPGFENFIVFGWFASWMWFTKHLEGLRTPIFLKKSINIFYFDLEKDYCQEGIWWEVYYYFVFYNFRKNIKEFMVLHYEYSLETWVMTSKYTNKWKDKIIK